MLSLAFRPFEFLVSAQGTPRSRAEGELGQGRAGAATCPVLAPFDAARPVAIGIDPTATGA